MSHVDGLVIVRRRAMQHEIGVRQKILRRLKAGPSYGLEIVEECGIPRGTVYVTLGRLEDMGLVKSRRLAHPVLYDLTDAGRQVLIGTEEAAKAFRAATAWDI